MASIKAVEIRINSDDNVERCLKKFKRMCESYGVAKEYRKRKEYRKPSVKSKEKTESAIKRRNKAQFKNYRQTSKI